mgnify:CR=1 FL=1
MDLAILSTLNAERAARRATILVTDVESGAQRLVKAADLAADPLAEALEKQLRMGKSALVEADGKSFFLTVQAPPPRVIVSGAVHISQAMAPMAKLLDLLGVPAEKRDFAALGEGGRLTSGTALPAPSGIFPRHVESEGGEAA